MEKKFNSIFPSDSQTISSEHCGLAGKIAILGVEDVGKKYISDPEIATSEKKYEIAYDLIVRALSTPSLLLI